MGLLDSINGDVQPTTAQPPAPQDNAGVAFNFFVSKGLSPHQAAGIVGNLMGESGQRLNTGAIDKGDGRDGSDSIGIGQWNSTRADALRAYANQKGTGWNDLNTQLEFLHSELQGPESKAYAALQASKTPEEAARAFLGYERPKDWNVPGSHPQRSRYAVQALNTYGDGQTPYSPAPSRMASAIMGQPQPAAPQMPRTPSDVASQLMGIQQPQQPAQQPSQQVATDQAPMAAPMQLDPIAFAARRSPDLSKLRAAFSLPKFNRG